MAQKGKKFIEKASLINQGMLYDVDEGLNLVKQTSFAKFDETVEASFRLNVNPSHADQQVRSTVVLSHGTGKKKRIAVFAKGEKLKEAEDAGADVFGDTDLIERVQKGFLDFDVAVATPDVMKDVGKLGKILGPRGLMPNPKTGTVSFDIKEVINEIKAGKIEFRCDKFGIIHSPIGKVSFSVEMLKDNFRDLYFAILKAKPSAVKGNYIRTVALCTTMGPGIKIDTKLMKKVFEEG